MCLCRQLRHETISFLYCRLRCFAVFLEARLESRCEKSEIFVGHGPDRAGPIPVGAWEIFDFGHDIRSA
jgi:hypothetical protein